MHGISQASTPSKLAQEAWVEPSAIPESPAGLPNTLWSSKVWGSPILPLLFETLLPFIYTNSSPPVIPQPDDEMMLASPLSACSFPSDAGSAFLQLLPWSFVLSVTLSM